jgi:hypothetical protein
MAHAPINAATIINEYSVKNIIYADTDMPAMFIGKGLTGMPLVAPPSGVQAELPVGLSDAVRARAMELAGNDVLFVATKGFFKATEADWQRDYISATLNLHQGIKAGIFLGRVNITFQPFVGRDDLNKLPFREAFARLLFNMTLAEAQARAAAGTLAAAYVSQEGVALAVEEEMYAADFLSVEFAGEK